jgi:glycosyltransferase involved in cell wall biosynthesis
LYHERYPDIPNARLAVIENGYDEENFAPLDGSASRKHPLLPGTFTLLHSGIVYPSERDPTQLFRALRLMLDEGSLKPGELRVRLRAPAHEARLAALVDIFRVAEVVELAPPIPYRQALEEMMRADGLLVLQASNCNDQIPAKVYEYLRCKRPIIALTDPAGDTSWLLRKAGIHDIARLDSAEDIALALRRFLDQVKRGEATLPSEALVAGASRLHRARELASMLDHLPIQ